jgi:hypothetical protein
LHLSGRNKRIRKEYLESLDSDNQKKASEERTVSRSSPFGDFLTAVVILLVDFSLLAYFNELSD